MCFFFQPDCCSRGLQWCWWNINHMGSLVTIADKNYFTSWAMSLVTSLVVLVFVYSCAWDILWSSACHTFTTLQSVVADFPLTAECLKLYSVKTPHWDYCVTRVNKVSSFYLSTRNQVNRKGIPWADQAAFMTIGNTWSIYINLV